MDPEGLVREGLTTFDIESLPEQVQRVRGGVRVMLYPSLVDTGSHAAVRLMQTQAAAEHASRSGLMRLYVLAEKKRATFPGTMVTGSRASASIPRSGLPRPIASGFVN